MASILKRQGGFKSKYSTEHLSDALRIALVHKHGGWYLDLDFVVIKSLSDLAAQAGSRNLLSSIK